MKKINLNEDNNLNYNKKKLKGDLSTLTIQNFTGNKLTRRLKAKAQCWK